MFLYLSGWTGTGTATDPFVPRAAAPVEAIGGRWSVFDLRTMVVDAQGDLTFADPQPSGWCLVSSDVAIGLLPQGVTFLFDDANLDVAVPAQQRNTMNNQLGTAIPNGATWREALRSLAYADGKGKWGVVLGPALNFATGTIVL